MRRVKKSKKIKILSRGFVFTSRGRCRTPILRPYVESCDIILQMLSKDNAEIVEVLEDGREVKLTIQNFASDNSVVEEKEEVVEVAQKEEPKRQLTRRERRELERKEREAAQKAKKVKVEEPVVTEVVEEKPVEEAGFEVIEPVEEVVETAAVPEDSIEE